jgi:hypothetical protein
VATGDAAAGKGLKTYTDSLLVKDVDEGLNQRGDDIAATMTRLDTVEGAVNQPIFSVFRGTQSQPVGSAVWSTIGGAFAQPTLNDGFTEWNGSTLTVAKAGVYRIVGHVQFVGEYQTVGVQIVRNTTNPDTTNTLAKGEISGGPSADANGLRRLVAGDTLRFLVFQVNAGAGAAGIKQIGPGQYDLTWSVEWVRA